MVQTQVAHHRGHERVLLERAPRDPIQRRDGQHVIAVNEVSRFITQLHAVTVAVVRDPDVRPMCAHGTAHGVRIRAAAFLVDVRAVRRVVQHGDPRPQFLQHARRALVRRAVAHIHHHVETFQRHAFRKRRLRKLDIAPQRVIDAHRLANLVGSRAYLLDLAAEHQPLDLFLDRIVELVPVVPEKLDAVVFVGIVRGGEHDARVGAQRAGGVRNARRGQRPDQQHVHAHRENARRDRVLQHVPAQPRVLADNDLVAAMPFGDRSAGPEDVRGGATEFQGRF